MLANVLIENNIDITAYFIGFLNGKLGIEAADALLPTILNILFTSGSTVTTYENGSKQTISLPLGDINKLLGLLPTFGLNIGWETFGLPNLDPIMRQFLGFGLEDILGREWPLMNISINTHTILGTVNTTSEDGTIVTKEAYLFDGIGINIYTPEIIDKNGNRTPEEYYLNLNVKPMRMGPADKKVDINFANYDLTEEGKQNRYKEAGLANLELDASLFLQSDENGQFTLHDVLGDVVNLGAAGDIPFRFEGTNGGGSTYEFRLNVKTDIDFFDGNKTNLQLNLYYQDQAFIRMYYTEKTLYINMEAFKDANNVQLIPNLKVTGIDITQLLSGNLGVIYPYLDPNYTAPAEGDTPSNVFNEGEEGTEGGTEGGGFDVMGLISFLVGYINLPEGEPRIISLDLDNEAINALLGMFIDFGGKELGLKGIHLSFDQDDIFHTIELGVELSDSVRFGLKLNDVGYFATPVFDNYEMVDSAAERDSYTDINPLNTRYYSAQFGGNLDLGFEETDGGIDLSGMMSLFLKNVGLGIGVTFTDEMRLGYEVKANLDILQLNQIDIVAIFYYRDAQGNRTDFMMVNYNGGDDALYLNLQDVKKLQDAYPGLNFIGTLPKLKIPNIGLADTLGDINIISLITGIINPGQGGTETQEAAYTFSTPQQLVYDIFSAYVVGEYLLSWAGENAPDLLPQNGDETGTGTEGEVVQDGFNILALIANGLEGVSVDYALQQLEVALNAQFLSVLMAMLNMPVAMPEIRAALKIQVVGKPADDGYVEIDLAILDSVSNNIDAISIKAKLIKDFKFNIGKIDNIYGDLGFDVSTYTDIDQFIDTLSVGLEVGGNIKMTSDSPTYSNDYLDGLIAGLIKGLSLRFHTPETLFNLTYSLKADVNLNGGKIDNLYDSKLALVVTNADTGEEILGIYYLDRNLYLNLTYFGMPGVCLTDAGALIENLIKGGLVLNEAGKTTTVDGDKIVNTTHTREPASLGVASLYNLGTIADYATFNNTEAIALQLLIGPDKAGITLTKNVILAIISTLIDSDLPVEIQDTTVEIGYSDGITFKLETGVDSFNLGLYLDTFEINVMRDEMPVIELPDVEFNASEGGMPKSIYVSFGGNLRLNSIPNIGEDDRIIDLSPGLAGLLPGFDLVALLSFVGLVDVDLHYLVEGNLNISDIIKSQVKLTIQSKGEDGAYRDVLMIAYNAGDLYIDTELLGIGKLYIQNVESFFEGLLNKANEGTDLAEGGAATQNAAIFNAGDDEDTFKQFVNIYFVEGGLRVEILKGVIVSALKSLLGVDIDKFLSGIEITVEAEVSLKPIDISLGFDVSGVNAGLNIGELVVLLDKQVEMPAKEDGYILIEELQDISVTVNGSFELSVTGSEEGEDFSSVIEFVQEMLKDVPLGGIDTDALLNFGFLFKVLGERFGGTINYTINAILNLTDISKLNLSLVLTSAETGEEAMSFYILPNPDKAGALDAYVDFTKLGGNGEIGLVFKNKIKIRDIQGLIASFTQPSAVDGTGDGVENKSILLPQNATPGSELLTSAHILLLIASNPELYTDGYPVALKVTSGAIFGLLAMLGVDLEALFNEHAPEVNLGVGGADHFVNFEVVLKDLLKVGFTLDGAKVEVNPSKVDYDNIAKDPSYYCVNATEDLLAVQVGISGSFTFSALDTDESNQISFNKIIGAFLQGISIDAILKNENFADQVISYQVKVYLNLRDLVSEGGLEQVLSGIKVLATIAIGDGTTLTLYAENGMAYIDLEDLNVGKFSFDITSLLAESADEIRNAVMPLGGSQSDGFAVFNAPEQLSAAYITLALGNNTGAVLTVATEVFAVILNALNLIEGVELGSLVTETLNNNLEFVLGIGNGSIIGVTFHAATYSLDLSFDKVEVQFQDDIDRPAGFNPAEYPLIDKNVESIYVEAEMAFGWEADLDAQYSFKDMISNLGLIQGLDIAPVLSVLEQISTQFSIELRALINFTDFFSSDISVILYDVSVVPKKEVLSVYFVGGDLYLDAECFNIQKVHIIDAIDYFSSIFSSLTESEEGSGTTVMGTAAVFNAHGTTIYDPLSTYINLLLCPEGLIISLGSGALFTLLETVGLDLDIAGMVGPVGVVLVEGALMDPDNLLSFAFQFYSYQYNNDVLVTDEEGNPVLSERKMALNLSITRQFLVRISPEDDTYRIDPPQGYVTLQDSMPTFGFSTTVAFEFRAGMATVDNLYKDPIKALLGQVLTDFIFDIIIELGIQDDQAAKFEFQILANLNPLNLLDIEMQVVINKYEGDLNDPASVSRTKLAQLNLSDSTLYVDLSPLGGPKFCVVDVMETLLGLKDFNGTLGGDEVQNKPVISAEELVNAGIWNAEDAIQNPSLDISAQIMESGLFVFVQKAAFETLTQYFLNADFDMFSEVLASFSLKPQNNTMHIGAGLSVSSESAEIFGVGLEIRGIRVNFVPWSREELINPQTSNYIQAHDIDVISLDTSFEIEFAIDNGKVNINQVFRLVFDLLGVDTGSADALMAALPSDIVFGEDLGDTLVFDIKAKINIKDFANFVNNLQLRINISSKKAPDKFNLDFALYKTGFYLDATTLGLGKIRLVDIDDMLKDLQDMIDRLTGGGANPDDPAVANAPESLKLLTSVPDGLFNASPDLKTLAGAVRIALSRYNGFTITVAKDLIFSIFGLLNVDIESYIGDMIVPTLSVNVSPDMTYSIRLDLRSGNETGLLETALEYLSVRNEQWAEQLDAIDPALAVNVQEAFGGENVIATYYRADRGVYYLRVETESLTDDAIDTFVAKMAEDKYLLEQQSDKTYYTSYRKARETDIEMRLVPDQNAIVIAYAVGWHDRDLMAQPINDELIVDALEFPAAVNEWDSALGAGILSLKDDALFIDEIEVSETYPTLDAFTDALKTSFGLTEFLFFGTLAGLAFNGASNASKDSFRATFTGMSDQQKKDVNDAFAAAGFRFSQIEGVEHAYNPIEGYMVEYKTYESEGTTLTSFAFRKTAYFDAVYRDAVNDMYVVRYGHVSADAMDNFRTEMAAADYEFKPVGAYYRAFNSRSQVVVEMRQIDMPDGDAGLLVAYKKAGGIGLGMSLIGDGTMVGIEDEIVFETHEGIESSVVPLISKEERETYQDYFNYSVLLETNFELNIDLKDGNLEIGDIIEVIFDILTMAGIDMSDAKFDTDIEFAGGNETLNARLYGKFGIDFQRLLSRDPEQQKQTLVGEVALTYQIIDAVTGEVFEQTLAKAYMVDDILYITLNLYDTEITFQMADLGIAELLVKMFGVEPEEGGNASEDPDSPEAEPQNAADAFMAQFRAIGEGQNGVDILKSIILLNSEGFKLILTKEVVVSVIEFVLDNIDLSQATIDVTEIDFDKLISGIFDSASIAPFHLDEDGTFSIMLNVRKDQEEINPDGSNETVTGAGYDITLKFFDRTKVSGVRKDFDEYRDYLKYDEELQALFSSAFDSRDVNWRVNVNTDIELSADFFAYILDWSNLFSMESVDTAFYIQVLEQMSGVVTMRLNIDVDMTSMLKGNLTYLTLDAFIEFYTCSSDELRLIDAMPESTPAEQAAKDEAYHNKLAMGLYFMGNLHQPDYTEVGPRIFLRAPNLGIDGIELNSEVFENFINFNLNKLIGTDDAMNYEDWLEELKRQEEEEKNNQQNQSDSAENIAILQNAMKELGAPLNEGDASGDEGVGGEEVEESNAMWITQVLSALRFTKGKITLVVAQTALQTILTELLNFPFNEVGNISLELDNINNHINFNFAIDYHPPYDAEHLKTAYNEILADPTATLYPAIDRIWPKEYLDALDEKFPVFDYSDLGVRMAEARIRYGALDDNGYSKAKDTRYYIFSGVTDEILYLYLDELAAVGYIRSSVSDTDNNGNTVTYHLIKNSVSPVTGALMLIDGDLILALSDTNSNFNIDLKVGNIDVNLGASNLFADKFGENYESYLAENFKPLDEYKWFFEVVSELTIDDTVGGLFDLTETISTLLGMDIGLALQPAEDLHVSLEFALRGFIDFSDLSNLRIQLSVKYNGNEIALISYIGGYTADGVENGTVYVDLSGLTLPAVKLEGIPLGSLVKDLLGSIGSSSSAEENQPAVTNASDDVFNAPADYEGPKNMDYESRPSFDTMMQSVLGEINLEDIDIETPLLLITSRLNQELSVAITGALAYSLIAGISGNENFRIPMFKDLKIGFSKDELPNGKDLYGLVIRLTDDTPYEKAFTIAYNFTKGQSVFDPGIRGEYYVNAETDAEGNTIAYESIDAISKLALSLDMELRLRTRAVKDQEDAAEGEIATGEKSEQMESLEGLIESLLGIAPGTVEFDLQDSILVFGLSLKIFTNLADMTETTMLIELTYNEERLLAIYFLGINNAVYADLSGLGLFRAAINGLDLMGVLGELLGGVLTPGVGLDVMGLLGGLFSGGSDAEGDDATVQNAASFAEASEADGVLPFNASNVRVGGASTAEESGLIRILLGNEELTINPSTTFISNALSKITGMQMPALSDIRFSTNISYGLNNMNLRIKIDPQGNNLTVNVPQDMFKIVLGSGAEQYRLSESEIGTANYGGIVGITLGQSTDGTSFNADILALAQTLLDTIDLDNFKIFYERRINYWYLRNLAAGGTQGFDAFSGGDQNYVGPTYFGYDDAGYASTYSVKFTLGSIEFDFKKWGINTFTPQMMSNAYRRLRIAATKSSDNIVRLALDQLTAVYGYDDFNNIEDRDKWTPMGAAAFIRAHQLYISLENLLVIDLSAVVEWIFDRALPFIGEQLGNLIMPGLGGTLGKLLAQLINALVGELVADLVAEMIGDLSGYGNPLKVGKIIDDLMGGGVPLPLSLYLPELLGSLLGGDEAPQAYGSISGTVKDVDGNPIQGATVKVGNFTTTTDKDGNYALINLPADKHSAQISAPGYDTVSAEIEVVHYSNGPSRVYNFELPDERIEFYDNITVAGKVTNHTGAGLAGITFVYNGQTVKDEKGNVVTTGSDGSYRFVLHNVREGSFRISTSNGLSKTATASSNNQVITLNFQEAGPVTTGTLTGRLIVIADEYLLNGTEMSYADMLKQAGGETYNGGWQDFVATIDSRLTTVLANNNLRPDAYGYGTANNAYYVKFGTDDTATYNTLISQLGGYGYEFERVGSFELYHAIRTASGTGAIIEVRYLSQNKETVLVIKQAEAKPIGSDVELWLESGGRTIRQSDSFDGTTLDTEKNADGVMTRVMMNTPRDYFVKRTSNDTNGLLGTGYFTVGGLAFNKSYTLKFRSKVYENFDSVTVTMSASDHTKDVGVITLVQRTKPQWITNLIEVENPSVIQGVRLRLGADVLDANSSDKLDPSVPGYTEDGIPRTLYDYGQQMGANAINGLIGLIPSIGGLLPGVSSGQEAYLDEKGKLIFYPWNNYVNGYEGGAEDRYNSVHYFEVWLNGELIASALGSLYNMIYPLIGISPISRDQQYTIADLAAIPAGTDSDDIEILRYQGLFDETDDHKIYDYVYSDAAMTIWTGESLTGEERYWRNVYGAQEMLTAGFISAALNAVLTSGKIDVSANLITILQGIISGIDFLDGIIDMATRLVSHLLPIPFAYNMVSHINLNGSPLGSTMKDTTGTESYNVKSYLQETGVLYGTPTVTGQSAVPVVDDYGNQQSGYAREFDYYDKSTYAKITLNHNVDAVLERIVLFLNGATFPHERVEGNRKGQMIVKNWSWMPNATVMRADMVRYNRDGSVMADDLATHEMLQKWIKSNVTNSYLIINDYEYVNNNGVIEKYLIAKLYVRDVYGHFDSEDFEFGDAAVIAQKDEDLTDEEALAARDSLSAKDDQFLELDIANSGLRLRVVKSISLNDFVKGEPTNGPMTTTPMLPPDKVVFHDPYNPLDFTAYGGTWANEQGGVRHNIGNDGNYIVDEISDILPNRNLAVFNDGTSTGSTGIEMYWDLSMVKFNATETDKKSYIIGYCGNQTYGKVNGVVTKIEAVVEGGMIVDPSSTLKLNDEGTEEVANDKPAIEIPTIDPLTFTNIEDYIADLPTIFTYAAKMRYETYSEGEYQQFEINGETRDYLLKRYVFNDVTWGEKTDGKLGFYDPDAYEKDGSLIPKEVSYNGGDVLLPLRYGYRRSVDKDGAYFGSSSPMQTIYIRVPVLDRSIVNLNSIMGSAEIDNSNGGVIDGTIEIDPLRHDNVKAMMEGIKAFKATTPAGDIASWEVVGVDASQLATYDPNALSHPVYEVFYTFRNGNLKTTAVQDGKEVVVDSTQTYAVKVKILSKNIVSSSLDKISEEKLHITPYANDGLGLPDTITVNYGTSIDNIYSSEVLSLADGDFTWSIPDLTNFLSENGATTHTFTVKALIGAEAYRQELELVYTVDNRKPIGVADIVVWPYTDQGGTVSTLISNRQKVKFFDGVNYIDMEADIAFDMASSGAIDDSHPQEHRRRNPDPRRRYDQPVLCGRRVRRHRKDAPQSRSCRTHPQHDVQGFERLL